MRNYLIICCMILLLSVNSSTAQDATINIFHINDTHSNYSKGRNRDENLIGNYGGMAKATTVIGMLKAEDPEALLFHGGDFFMGDLYFYYFFGVPELMWMKQVGFNAAVIGNHEFDLTTGALVQSINTAYPEGGISLLSANLKAETETGELLKQFIKDWDTTTVHGIKVGYFGLTSPIANMISSNQPDINIIGDEAVQLVEIAQKNVDKLKSEGADLIVCLSHLGIDNDQLLFNAVNGVDIVLSAHDHYTTTEPIVLPHENYSTYIVQAGSFFEFAGIATVEIKSGKLSKFNYNLIALDENIPDEEMTTGMIESLIQSLPENDQIIFKTSIGSAESNLEELIRNVSIYDDQTTAVGSLMADALKNFKKTDIAITTCGSSAQMLYKGPLTFQDIVKMVGTGVNEKSLTGYNPVTFDISGAALKQGIMFCLSQSRVNDELLPQVAGMTFKYDYKKESIIHELLINDQPVLDDMIYSVTTDFLIYSYMSFIHIPVDNVIKYDTTSVFKIIADYISEISPLRNENYSGRVTNGPTTDVNEDNLEININFQKVTISPNPSSEILKVNVFINIPEIYEIEILNIEDSGKYYLENKYFEAGENNFDLNVSRIKSGNYLVRIKNNKEVLIGKVAIIR